MSEIFDTLETVRLRLNEYLRNATPREGDWVVLSDIVDLEGKPVPETQNRLVMFLAGIQRETAVSTYNPNVPVAGKGYAVVAPPLYIDLFVLFYANFSGTSYDVGLTVISRTIRFFQQSLWLNHDNLPGLDPRIEKLTFELVNLETADLNYLIGLAGARYLPSVYYKVRRIPFLSGAMMAQAPAVQGLDNPKDVTDSQAEEAQP